MKKKLTLFLICMIVALALSAGLIVYLDPFLVYHAPLEEYYYTLDSQRYQNKGIIRFYEYDALIAGTSLTQNFSLAQMENLFGVTAIRASISGSTMYEAAQEVDLAVESGHDLQLVLRSLDLNHLIEDADARREDLGDYPDYLFNDNPFDDVNYIFNRDVLIDYCLPMLTGRLRGESGGATDMESYNTNPLEDTGAEAVLAGRTAFDLPRETELEGLSEEQCGQTLENVNQNILRLAHENPDTLFLYFIAPYNAVWWGQAYEDGVILQYLEAEELALKAMLEIDNIEVYCFTNELTYVTDLSWYADITHFTDNVNDWILERMAAQDERYLVTQDNLEELLKTQRTLWLEYDYDSLIEEGTDSL